MTLWNDIFIYKEGELFWKIDRSNVKAGERAGYVKTTGRGYKSRYVCVDNRHYVEARVIYEMHNGEIPEGYSVDHANNNSLDNTADNLRLATPQQQCSNQIIRKDNSSGYKGVSWHKQKSKWQAQISVSGKKHHLGHFDSPELAYTAYCDAAKEAYGKFVNLG